MQLVNTNRKDDNPDFSVDALTFIFEFPWICGIDRTIHHHLTNTCFIEIQILKISSECLSRLKYQFLSLNPK